MLRDYVVSLRKVETYYELRLNRIFDMLGGGFASTCVSVECQVAFRGGIESPIVRSINLSAEARGPATLVTRR